MSDSESVEIQADQKDNNNMEDQDSPPGTPLVKEDKDEPQEGRSREGDGHAEEGPMGDGQTASPCHSLVDSISLSSDESALSDNPRRLVPQVNCPEKIILCIDLSHEMNEKSFQSRSAPDWTVYQFVQKASKIFVKNKSQINPSHEFGIIVLEDEASWYQQFESNSDMICTVLDHLSPNEQDNSKEEFDILNYHKLYQPNVHTLNLYEMESLFQAIYKRISLPLVEELAIPPPYVVRVILMYGRSQCVPVFTERSHQILHTMLESPYFFFDVLYVHELPSENNKCEAIYDSFCELDEDEVGYMLEVSRSTIRLFDHMASLLTHSLQRPKQRDTFYRLQAKDENDV